MNVVVILSVLLGVVLLVLVGLFFAWRNASGRRADSERGLIQQQITDSAALQDKRLSTMSEQLTQAVQNMTTVLNERLNQNQNLAQQTQTSIATRLEQSGKTIAQLNEQLGRLGQAAQNIMQVGGDIRKLQDILQSPKLRGGMGEWSLENLLADVLPQQHYHLQYKFRSGQIVDALVDLAQGRVSIDAKFPLENFQRMIEADNEQARTKARREFLRDVRKHIDAISDKYIVPEEGTLDFALMYLPAEHVYYEAVRSDPNDSEDIAAYGRKRHVIAVSPNTLYAYLMVVAMGLKGLRIEKNAQMIRQKLGQLQGGLELFNTDFLTVGKHLLNARSKYDDAKQKIDQFNLHLQQIETETAEEMMNDER